MKALFLMQKNFAPLSPLFDVLMYEEELSILLADTNLGKSILAIQIADEICNPSSEGLVSNLAKERGAIIPQPNESEVIYFDFEMSDRQFKHRYTNSITNQSYQFSDKVSRYSLDWEKAPDENLIEAIMKGFKQLIEARKPKLLIIDNITYLQAEGGITSKEANLIMKGLKRLKETVDNGMSILVIAHTPKLYDNSSPITLSSLAGIKSFSNFADSIFCIGKSYQDNAENLAYIKQLKFRAQEKLYTSDYVILCERKQKDNGLLFFDFLGFGSEANHLFKRTKEVDKANRDAQIVDMCATHTLQQVADHFSISKGQVSKIKKKQSNNAKVVVENVS